MDYPFKTTRAYQIEAFEYFGHQIEIHVQRLADTDNYVALFLIGSHRDLPVVTFYYMYSDEDLTTEIHNQLNDYIRYINESD